MAEQVRGYCNLCHVHCPIICTVHADTVVRVEPDADHPAGGAMCVKGKAAPELLRAPERLRYPMRRTRPKGDPDPGWERITWDEALDLIAAKLRTVRTEHGPEAVAFSKGTSSGTAVSDAERWLQRLANLFGTPNVLGTTHLCQWHRDTGNTYTFGVPLPTPDFANAGVILLWGHNPSATSLAFARAIADAQRRGARLVVVDPRRVGLAARADLHLQGRPGTDGAIALALVHELLAHGGHDAAFVRAWTNAPLLVRADDGQLLRGADLGWPDATYVAWDARAGAPTPYAPEQGRYGAPLDALALDGAYRVTLADGRSVAARPVLAALAALAAAYAPDRAAAITGVPAARLREAAALLAAHRPLALYFWNGLAQHTNTTQSARALATLAALLGDFDAPGGNVLFPSLPKNAVEAGERLAPESANRRLGRATRPLGPPVRPGQVAAYDLYESLRDGTPYQVRALVGFGGNMVMSSAGSAEGREALRHLEFFAQAELFLTPTAALADIVLPAASFLEAGHLKIGYAFPVVARGHVQYRPAMVPPLGDARPDTWIIFQLARRLGLGDEFWDGDVDAAYAHELAPTGLTLEAVKAAPGGVTLPLPAPRYRKYAETDPARGVPCGFATPTRKVELYAVPFAAHGYAPLPEYTEPAIGPVSRPDLAAEYPLVWTTAKVTYFCHSQHRALPALRRGLVEPAAELHPDTARAHGIEDGAWMLVETPEGAVRVRARYTERILPGVVCGQHGWWQGCDGLGLPGYDPFAADGANTSRLVPNTARDPIGGATPSRSYLCRVRPAPATPEANLPARAVAGVVP
ncbi:MAG TPA: molybdopterin-dependent oxidoreductase [Chloroflexota bacterium]|nr:molybdopterin-dependent oxidoreductase [Chloroflexota bacterium]